MKALRSLYVDLNSFFASCEQQDRPEYRGKPLAVVPMLPDSTAVIAASYEAKAFGIKTGTKVGDAKRLCPGLILVPAAHGPYVRYHHKIIEAIDTVIPVRAVCSIDEIACELTGSQQQIEKARELSFKVKRAISEHVGSYMKCSIGIAPNFLLAKIACDMQKPDGLTILQESDLFSRLSTLKLQDIPGIGRRMEARLNSKGIMTMRELLEQGEQQTRSLWGSLLGARYHRLLKGEWIDLQASAPTQSIGHSHVLPLQERSAEGAQVIAHKLLWKAAIRLRHGGFMCRKLGLSIQYMDQTRFHQDASVSETQDTGLLLRELNRLYSQSFLKKKPLKVGITLSGFVSESHHQLSFFENERSHQAYKAVDALNAKFGRDTVYVGTLHNRLKAAPTRIAFSRIPGLDELDHSSE
jgi:DNA polymerase-4